MDPNLSHYEMGSILQVYVAGYYDIFLFMIADKTDDEDERYLINLYTGERYHIDAQLFSIYGSVGRYEAIDKIIIKRGGLKDEYKT